MRKKNKQLRFSKKEAKKLNRYKKIINILQNRVSITLDTSFESIEQSTHQRHPVFTHTLFAQVNTPIPSRQSTKWTIYIGNENTFTGNGKFTKVLPDLLIFTNRKNLSIN